MQEQSSGAAVLRIWEDAAAAPSERRGSIIVASAMGEPLAAVETVPVGQRDRRLLELRRSLIGDPIEARGACPECAAQVEAGFAISDLVAAAGDADGSRDIEVEGFHLTVRAPTAGELAALSRAFRDGIGDADVARQRLLRPSKPWTRWRLSSLHWNARNAAPILRRRSTRPPSSGRSFRPWPIACFGRWINWPAPMAGRRLTSWRCRPRAGGPIWRSQPDDRLPHPSGHADRIFWRWPRPERAVPLCAHARA
jgi:hypothetical protein